MSKEEPYRDQAEKLKQKVEKVDVSHDDDYFPLPPRSEVHRAKKKRTKLKIKYPLIRLLALFFILLPITIFSVYTYFNSKTGSGSKSTVVSPKGYENIKIENSKKNSKPDAKENTVKKQVNGTGDFKSSKSAGSKSNHSTDAKAASQSTNNAVTSDQTAGNGGKGQTGHSTGVSSPASTQLGTAGIPQSDNQKVVYHTVQPQETLYRIAMKYYHSKLGIETIKAENHLPDANIRVGQVLRIPLDK